MQKVVWPTTIVASDSEMLLKLKKALSAIPVMIPGSANGSTNRRLMTSRPKNLARWMANAAHEPRTSAIAVAARPACSDTTRAFRTFSSFQVDTNHFVVRPGIGQVGRAHV